MAYKNPFYNNVEKYVRDELNNREKIYGQQHRDNKHLEHLQKMAYVSVKCYDKDNYKEDEKDSKNRYISFKHRIGGMADIYEADIKDTNNNRYTPKPIMTNVEVSNEGRYGTIQRAKISFKVFNLTQLEQYGQYFFRPGNIVKINYGWSNLFGDANNDKYKGFVYNFSFSARSDGGFDCSVDSIGEGYSVFGVSIFSGANANQSEEIGDAKKIKDGMVNILNILITGDKIATEKVDQYARLDSRVTYSYPYGKGGDYKLNYVYNNMFVEYDRYKKFRETEELKSDKNWITESADNVIEGISTDKSSNVPIAEPPEDEYSSSNYISLGDLINLLNYLIIDIKKITDKNWKERQFIQCNNTIQYDIHVNTADPKKIVLPLSTYFIFKDSQIDSNYPKVDNEGDYVKAPDRQGVEKIIKADHYEGAIEQPGDAVLISSIMFSVDYLREILINAEEDNNSEHVEVSIKQFLQDLFSELSKLTGGIYNLTAYMDKNEHGDSIINIADINFSELGANEFKSYLFKPFTKDSIVFETSLESSLPDKMATAAYIGGAAALGLPTSMFDVFKYADRESDNQRIWNSVAITDDNTVGEFQLTNKRYVKAEVDKNTTMRKLYKSYSKLFTTFSDEDVSSVISALRLYKSYASDEKTWNKKIIYPIKASITLEGIAGFRFGNIISIGWLPKVYKERMEFMITKVNHTIENNTWKTQLELQCRLK